MRSLEGLTDPDPAWPGLEAAVAASPLVVDVLPRNAARCDATLLALQVTTRSTLGALAHSCGGLAVDHGWLRILGGGTAELPGLAQANPELRHESAPPILVVAVDVLGGLFAIDGGGLGIDTGSVCYWAPETLSWEDVGQGHTDFVRTMIGGATTRYYADQRWTGWVEEVGDLALDVGLSTYPLPWTVEGQDLSAASRRPVPLAELVAFNVDCARQVDGASPIGVHWPTSTR